MNILITLAVDIPDDVDEMNLDGIVYDVIEFMEDDTRLKSAKVKGDWEYVKGVLK